MSALDVPLDLLVTPWRGASGEHDPRGLFVETYWLPILGPGATMVARRLSWHLEVADRTAGTFGCHRTTTVLVGHEAGLTGRLDPPGRHSPVNRAISRLCNFGLAALQPAAEFDGAYLLFRTAWPDLSFSSGLQLPPHLRAEWLRRRGVRDDETVT